MAGKYTVRCERDEDGMWVGSVAEVKGCLTQGRSIRQVRARIREALGLFVKDAKRAELVLDVELPSELRIAVRRLRDARERAEREREREQETARQVARLFAAKMSERDAGDVLGVSHQRIHQLVGKR